MSRVIAAIIQAEVQSTAGATLALSAAKAREARAQGARLLVFPETWLPGYPAWLDTCRDAALWNWGPANQAYARLASESVVVGRGGLFEGLQAIARDNEAVVVCGVTERVDAGPGRGTLYNALLTLGPDGILLNHHRKLVPTFSERLVWGPGDTAGLRAVDTPVGRIGGLVCWEHWMPLARYALHQSGEDIHVAVWPTVAEMHVVASRAHGFEGRCFVLAAGSLMKASILPAGLEPHPAKVQSPDALVLRGGSCIIAPNGQFVVEPVFDREAVLVAELDLDQCRVEGFTRDVTGHYQRPDAFEFSVKPSGRGTPLTIDN
ncbi:MAG TPA: carbon-nitrogen hydrolase family protein [Gemmatimonadales bacterium]